MATFSVAENPINPSPAMAAASQILTSGGAATITVVASGQTLLVQPTTIVNTSPPRHTILKQVRIFANRPK